MVVEPAVLIIGGGMLQVPLIEEALGLGLEVLLTDQNRQCPGRTLATHFWPISTTDVKGHQRLGETLRGDNPWGIVCGVATAGSDSAPSVAAAAQALGCQGIPLEVATRTHNKFQVRRTLSYAALDCYQPRVSHVEKRAYDQWMEQARLVRADTVWEDIQQSYQIPLPWVVKPLEQRASRGVTIVQRHEDYLQALDRMLLYGSECLVEEQLQGSEHSVETIFGNKNEVLWFNIVDRYFDYSSGTPLEIGHVNPTCLDAHAQQQILLMALAAAKALGVTWGPFKVDCMMTAEGPKVLECTARLSGGWDCQWSSPATDRHPMKLLLQLACGLPLDAQPQMAGADGYGAVAAIFPQQTGILQAVQYPLWAASGEVLRDTMMDRGVLMIAQPGDHIRPLEHNAQRCGYVMAHGHDYAATWATAQQVATTIADSMVITP